MSTFLGLFADQKPADEEPRVIPIRKKIPRETVATAAATSIHEEQIRALVQQVFFTHESSLVRHVGFVTVDASTEIASLCLDVATILTRENAYDVALIDAHPYSISLQTRLQIPPSKRSDDPWLIAPRLWMVPREDWLPTGGQGLTEQNASRLRELTAQFDFSVLCCAPVSWITAVIGQICDGVVLVLAANKTRRLVAAQAKEHLNKAGVTLLGTVLVERRFPVPPGLYRSL